MATQQILIQGSTEQEIQEVFAKYKLAVNLNWIKPHKEMFIVNFDFQSQKQLNRFPHDLHRVEFVISRLNRRLMEDLAQKLRTEGERIELGGSRALYRLDGKTYQIIDTINDPETARVTKKVFNILDVVETDEYILEKEITLSDEEAVFWSGCL